MRAAWKIFAPDLTKNARRQRICLLLLVLAALGIRVTAVLALERNLSADVDAYLGIAESLSEGRGFSSPGSHAPTAFRPPLYPLLVAGLLALGGGPLALGMTQAVLGAATVLLTWLIGRRLGLHRGALLAAGLVAVDPLLVLYTTYPMTETLFAFLATALVLMVVREDDRSRWQQAATGALFGLCALCRPTIWPFGALLAGMWLVRRLFSGRRAATADVRTNWPWPVVLGLVLTISPWVIRNWFVFGQPIVTTTHGGYTLLLGNNPAFYRQVVDRPWGTMWDDAPPDQTQAAWYAQVQAEMRRALGPHADEVTQDRWQGRLARRHIADEPRTFLRACWLRLRRLWNVVPMGGAAESLPRVLVWGVGLFYLIENAAALVGLIRLRRTEWPRWLPLALLIASITAVHLVYWSNARMRAPLIPAVALLAARGAFVRNGERGREPP